MEKEYHEKLGYEQEWVTSTRRVISKRRGGDRSGPKNERTTAGGQDLVGSGDVGFGGKTAAKLVSSSQSRFLNDTL